MSTLAATFDQAPDLTSFGRDIWWIVVIKVLIVFLILVLLTLFTIVAERIVVARMQQRIGPNRVGPRGSLQSLADGVKLMLKEDIIPALVDKPVYILAPILSVVPAFLAFSVIPFGPEVSIGGHKSALQLTDLPVGVLFILAMSSLGVYGLILSGWSSGSTYPLLGGLRSSAQVISYEVAMGLALVPVFLYSGTLSTSGVIASQSDHWYAWALPVSFIIYIICMVGETNRAPFDLPEAESELVGGFHTEYSSIKFALFFLAEYVNMVTVSALATTLFLGGWRPVWPISLWHGSAHGYYPMIWFVIKVLAFLFFYIWLRGTLPRLRYDQFMKFGWRVLIPVAVVWIMIVATFRTIFDVVDDRTPWFIGAGIVIGAVLLFFLIDPGGRARREREDAAEREKLASAPSLDAIPWPPVSQESSRVLAGALAGAPTSQRPSSPHPPARPRAARRSVTAPRPPPTQAHRRAVRTIAHESVLRPGQGVRSHLRDDVQEGHHRALPGGQEADGPPLSRAPRAQPARRRSREVRGVRALRVGLPADAIYVEGADNTEDARFSPGERYGAVYQINYLRCIFCGLCIEACPTRALTMSNEYELADDNRRDLIFTKEQLLTPLRPGMERPPHGMRLGDTEQDYFRRQPDYRPVPPADPAEAYDEPNSFLHFAPQGEEAPVPSRRPTSPPPSAPPAAAPQQQGGDA